MMNKNNKDTNPKLIINNIKPGASIRCATCRMARLRAPKRFVAAIDPPELTIVCSKPNADILFNSNKTKRKCVVTKEYYAKCVLTKGYKSYVR